MGRKIDRPRYQVCRQLYKRFIKGSFEKIKKKSRMEEFYKISWNSRRLEYQINIIKET